MKWTKILAVACAVLSAPYASAQTWPAKPIRWIVPFSVGGSTDQITRYVTQRLSETLGTPIVVENVVGAGGAIGLEKLAKSAPDGYTFGTTAFSLQAIAPRDPRGVVTCPICKTRHHKDCWDITGMCQVPHYHS